MSKKNELKVKTFGEMLKEGEEEDERLKHAFEETKTAFILRYPTHNPKGKPTYTKTNATYEIEKDRVKDAQELLDWIFQLTEKVWLEQEILRRFMAAATRHLKMRFPWN